jgi:hypothetical protein
MNRPVSAARMNRALAVPCAILAALALVFAHGASSHPTPEPALGPATTVTRVTPQARFRAETPRWWKGNTHTHSWWSDGDSAPETIAAWYQERGYQFLVFSDHNRMQQGEYWYPTNTDGKRAALADYRTLFGDDWVVTRPGADGVTEVKLKTLDEFRTLFESPGRFMFVKGQEITDRYYEHPVHLNGVNLDQIVLPQGGTDVATMLQRNVDAVVEQGRRSGRPTFVHVNHPNFHFAITIEDMLGLRVARGDGFVEIYNGHPGVRNEGDDVRASVERTWDILLAKRLGELGLEPIYGVATDDSHVYTRWDSSATNPGRGWIMVRAARLTPDTITAAIKRGDFYASTGVRLRDVQNDGRRLSVAVEPERGVKYRIEFVGTKRGADLAGRPVADERLERQPPDEKWRTSLRYSDEIGVVLRSVDGTSASYELAGDELYVRARIVSTKLHSNPNRPGDVEMAWTQPLVPAAR